MADEPTFINKRAPTLCAIIAFKLVHGALLLLLALGADSLSDNNLPNEFRELLRFLHLDPEKKFFTHPAEQIGSVSESKMVWLAGGTVFYSQFSLVEGAGLMFRVSWAGWMAIGESAFFVPIEVYELVYHPVIGALIVLALNVLIVWCLFQNRHRLFRHHHHH